MLDYQYITTSRGFWQNAIADLEYFTLNGNHFVAAVANVIGGGLSVYSLSPAMQPIERVSAWGFQPDFSYQGTPELTFLQFGTETNLHLSHLGGAENLGMIVRDTGRMGGFEEIFPQSQIGTGLSSLGQIATASGNFIYAAHQDSLSLTVYRADTGSNLERVSGYDFSATVRHASTYSSLDQVIDASVGGNHFLIGVSALGDFISTHRLGDTGTILGTNLHYGHLGAGYSAPNDLRAIEIEGKTYIVVASPGASSLTVFRLMANGGLIPTDHVIDEGFTNFQSISAFDTVSYQGRPYIFAGGIDDGISVFTLQPDGVLLHLRSIPDDFDMALSDIADIETAIIGNSITLIASSTAETGLTQLSFTPGTIGITGSIQGRLVSGGYHNDMLLSHRENREIRGQQGDDILIARHAGIHLWGGNGDDTFVPHNIGGRIVIRDFEPGRDQLDLSQLGTVRSLYQVQFREVEGGIRLLFHDARLDILTRSGARLTETDFSNAVFPITHYDLPGVTLPPIPPDLRPSDTGENIVGSNGSDLLSGGRGPDIVSAGSGNDTVNAGGGNDTLFGLAGADRLAGEDGDDLLIGNSGDDVMRGGPGDDRILGGNGHDNLLGGPGADSLVGNEMDDTLRGFLGADSIWGGSGNDLAFGEKGADLVVGGAGQDVLDGGDGNDSLYGEHDADSISGGLGDDILSGGSAEDSLQGGSGNDSISGNEGHDLVLGHQGLDRLDGEEGNDTLSGNGGHDRLAGHTGHDVLHGGFGADLIFGGSGTDRLVGGGGADRLTGGTGADMLDGGSGPDRLSGASGNDQLAGGKDADWLDGGEGSDSLSGNGGDDRIMGRAGNDDLSGGYGADTLGGGAAADTLAGGPGSDVFLFSSAGDSPAGARDIITDFETGRDHIDLSMMDLHFIGRRPFGNDHQLRWEYRHQNTHILADLDGDGRADFTVILNGRLTLTEDDFLL